MKKALSLLLLTIFFMPSAIASDWPQQAGINFKNGCKSTCLSQGVIKPQDCSSFCSCVLAKTSAQVPYYQFLKEDQKTTSGQALSTSFINKVRNVQTACLTTLSNDSKSVQAAPQKPAAKAEESSLFHTGQIDKSRWDEVIPDAMEKPETGEKFSVYIDKQNVTHEIISNAPYLRESPPVRYTYWLRLASDKRMADPQQFTCDCSRLQDVEPESFHEDIFNYFCHSPHAQKIVSPTQVAQPYPVNPYNSQSQQDYSTKMITDQIQASKQYEMQQLKQMQAGNIASQGLQIIQQLIPQLK